MHLTGQSSDEERSAAKHRLVAGEVRFIFMVDIYNEGVNIPEVNTVLFLRLAAIDSRRWISFLLDLLPRLDNPGETKEQALARACQEELAVTLSIGDVFMEVDHRYPDMNVHLTLFNAAICEGTPQVLDHNDILWITPAEIPQYNFSGG